MSNENDTADTIIDQLPANNSGGVFGQQPFSMLQWASTPQGHYNETAAFDDAIGPMVEIICAACEALGVPFYMVFMPGVSADSIEVRDAVGGISADRFHASIAVAAASVREDEVGVDNIIESAARREAITEAAGQDLH